MKDKYDYLNDVKMDFSIYEDYNLSELESKKMKNAIKTHKKISIGKLTTIAACITMLIVCSQTTFAKNIINNIIKSISTGHNQFTQVDNSVSKLPDELVGFVFDRNGNSVTNYAKGTDYYDKDGNKITDFRTFIKENINVTEIETENETVRVAFSDETTDPLEQARNDGYPVITDEKTIDRYLSFNSKLPSYLPLGFSFYGATAMGTDYLFVYYKNQDTGKWFAVHERIINENTTFESSTDGTLEETKVNKNKAVITDNRNIDWECDGISIGVLGRGEISKDELIKVAKTIK